MALNVVVKSGAEGILDAVCVRLKTASSLCRSPAPGRGVSTNRNLLMYRHVAQ